MYLVTSLDFERIMAENLNDMTNDSLSAALWLSKHTDLTPKQISQLCPEVHEFKIILLRSGTCNIDAEALDPIESGFLSKEQIDEVIAKDNLEIFQTKDVKRYIPKILRGYIPGVIIWLKNNYPHLSSKDIAIALGTTPKRVSDIILANEVPPVSPLSVQIFNETTLRALIKR